MTAVRCPTCGWKGNRKTDLPLNSSLPKPCPGGHPVLVGAPPPSAVETTPSGMEICFYDSENIETGLPQRRKYLVNGEKLPSVTTVLDVLGKPGLTHWVAKTIYAGLNWEEERDRAGERGRQAHDLVLRTVLKKRTSLSDVDDEYRAWCQAAFRWLADRRPKVVEAERMVASTEYGYSGRFDLLAHLRDLPGLPLVDLKTVTEWKEADGKRRKPFAQNALQLDLYSNAIEESGYQGPDYGMVVRLGPDGTYDEHFVSLSPARGLKVLDAFNAVKDAGAAFSSEAPMLYAVTA